MVPISILISVVSILVGGFMSLGGISINPILLLGALAYGLCIGSFNTLNSIFDVKSDRISKPERPLPSMEISKRDAFIFYLILTTASLIIAYLLNVYLLVSCILVTLFSLLYSIPPIKLKRILYLNTLIVAVCYSLIPISAGWLIFSGLDTLPWHILTVLTILSFGMVIAKDIQDITADRIFGVATIPIIYGIGGAGGFLKKLILIPYLLVVAFVVMKILNPLYLVTLIPLIGAIHLSLSMESCRKESSGHKLLMEAAAIGISTEILFLISYLSF